MGFDFNAVFQPYPELGVWELFNDVSREFQQFFFAHLVFLINSFFCYIYCKILFYKHFLRFVARNCDFKAGTDVFGAADGNFGV